MATSAIIGGVGAGLNAIQGISSSMSSKNAGQKAARQADQRQNQIFDALMGGAGPDGTRSGGMLGSVMDNMQNSVSGLNDQAASGYQDLANIANQLQGIDPQFQFAQAPTVGGYDFTAGDNLMDQSMDAFRTQAEGTRNTAMDQMAAQSSADMRGLDAALAARGLSQGSGVASGALSDLVGQQGMASAGLERDLATLGSQTALQGAQFDVQRALQQQQMQSGYGLGVDQLRSQNWQADQSMRSNYGLQQAGLRQQGLLGAGNLLNSGMGNVIQAGLGSGNMYGNMLSPILSSLIGMQGMSADQVSQAGRGAGSNPFGQGLLDLAGILGQSK